jgi:hypothetical protein
LKVGLKVACWIVREPREEPDFGPSWGLLFERNTVIRPLNHRRS